MKIIFFGLGSIGQRHARLLLKNFNHTIYAYRSSRAKGCSIPGINEVYSWDEVKKISPEVAFITNPTFLHIKTAIECGKLGINLFIEKPIDSGAGGLNELLRLVKKKRLTAYVAYCMRFHPVIKRIRELIFNEKILHCRIVASSYLPTWRKNQDYQDAYSAKSSQGGGVILDLSHELDYCQYLFGDIYSMQGIYGRLSKLDIDSEDFADILLECKKGIVNLHLNFFSKNIIRKITIDLEDSNYIEGDLIRNSLCICKNKSLRKRRFSVEKDEIYLQQLRYFFKNLHNPGIMNNITEAADLFKKIVGLKNAPK